MCSLPRQLNSKHGQQYQSINLQKNTTSSDHSKARSEIKNTFHNTRTSKDDLFGSNSDSDEDLEAEKEKKCIKKIKKDEEEKLKQPARIIHNKRKNSRSSLSINTKVDVDKNSIEQIQSNVNKGLSSSHLIQFIRPTTNHSETKVIDKRIIKQNSLNHGAESTTSDSYTPQRPANRKSRAILIESKSDDLEDDLTSPVYQRKWRRKRRISSGSQEDSGIDNNQSRVEQKTCLTGPLNTCTVSQDEKQIEQHEQLSVGKHLPPSSKILKRNSASLDLSPKQYKKLKIGDLINTSGSVYEAIRRNRNKNTLPLSPIDNDDDDDAMVIGNSENDTQVPLKTHEHNFTNTSSQPQSDSDCDSDVQLEIVDNPTSCLDSSTPNSLEPNKTTPKTRIDSTITSQKGQVLRTSRLGPVALIEPPRLTRKPEDVKLPKLPKTQVPAGSEYIDKLFSKLNQRIKRSSVDPTQETTSSKIEEGSSSNSQVYVNQPVRGIDYQGESPILLPNIYGTLRPVTPIQKPKLDPNTSLSKCKADQSLITSHPPLPSSSHVFPSTEQTQPHPISTQPHPTPTQPHPTPAQPYPTPSQASPTSCQPYPTPGQPHPTPHQSHPTPCQPHFIPSQHPQCPDASSLPWLPEVIPERVLHQGKQQNGRNESLLSSK